MVNAIAEELRAIREEFADERRTRIVDEEGEILTEELIDQEDVVVTRTHLGYIKRTRVREYEAQGRGGRGITGAASTEGDFITDMFRRPRTTRSSVHRQGPRLLQEGLRVARGLAHR